MGCINSKKARSTDSPPPYYLHSEAPNSQASVIAETASRNSGLAKSDHKSEEKKKNKKNASKGSASFSQKVGISHRHMEAEQNAAGWPSWLTGFAGEAIHGWVPLRADSFEKLDKIGQGTYSSVFRAREVMSGRMFALKKVRFDNLQPESIRFMAREITILRRLDHPNVMKLEGLITSRNSSSIYLVFEYMEHDLAGLVSCPDIQFGESQIKCYMQQLLSGLEHCHVHGVMHRDIKASNILVNNEGVLKIGDFGLANTMSPGNKHPLTSRVVTLWYRPPELLMGSTNYGVSVDLWSAGCVFAELFIGKPMLKGRTEVEQLHKVFRLCGSPPEEFWKKSKLPHSTMFKPQANYDSCLREKCTGFPETAINLLETLLAIDPSKRGTASSALMSEYFSTAPYACDPSSLPKYPPNKEMDAKNREDAQRKRTGGVKVRESGKSRKQRRPRKILQEQSIYTLSSQEEAQNNFQNAGNVHHRKGGAMHREPHKPSLDAMSEVSEPVMEQLGYAGAVPISVASGLAWARRRQQDVSSTLSDGSRSKISALDTSFAKGTYDLSRYRMELLERSLQNDNGSQQGMHSAQYSQPMESFDGVDVYNPSNVSMDFDPAEYPDVYNQGYEKHDEFEIVGPRPPHRLDELMQKNENSMRRAVRRSRFGNEQ